MPANVENSAVAIGLEKVSFHSNSEERQCRRMFMKVKLLSRVRLFETPWTVAHQGPPPVGFSRQQYWRGLPFPSPEDLYHPGIKARSPASQAVSYIAGILY